MGYSSFRNFQLIRCMEDLHFGVPFPVILMIDNLGAPSDKVPIPPRAKILYTYYRLEEKSRPPSLIQTI